VTVLASVTVVLTVVYISRVLIMTFEGKFKGGADADPADNHGESVHLEESPLIMVLPLLALAVPAAFAGILLNSPWDIGIVSIHGLSHFLHVDATELNVTVFAVSTIVTPIIFVAAIQMFRACWMDRWQGLQLFGVGKHILTNKYYMDELYDGVITVRLFYRGLAASLDWFDRAVVDGVVRLTDRCGRNIGRGIALVQAGQLQGYGIAISIGVLSLFGFFMIWR
jgi:NADH-quinone oxidoreductase subunit L